MNCIDSVKFLFIRIQCLSDHWKIRVLINQLSLNLKLIRIFLRSDLTHTTGWPKLRAALSIIPNLSILYSCGWFETETFENNYVTVLDSSKYACSLKDGGWAKTIKRRNVWTRFCLKTEERTLRFRTKTDVCGQSVDFQRPRGITDGMDYILVRLKNILGSFTFDHF